MKKLVLILSIAFLAIQCNKNTNSTPKTKGVLANNVMVASASEEVSPIGFLILKESVNAPRFHHQWKPDVITLESKGFSSKLVAELEAKGYKINKEDSRIIGKVDTIIVLPNETLECGADYRGDNKAVGFKFL